MESKYKQPVNHDCECMWCEFYNHLHHIHMPKDTPPWIKAFPNLDISDEDKKVLYERLKDELILDDWKLYASGYKLKF